MLRLPRADMGALPARYGAVSMLWSRFDAARCCDAVRRAVAVRCCDAPFFALSRSGVPPLHCGWPSRLRVF